MDRGPLYADNYQPQLSGHETFPLRYGWLKKAFDAVEDAPEGEGRAVFTDDASIARFGVGRNMVASIRHWATAAGILKRSDSGHDVQTTELGALLFGDEGIDPFMEEPDTSWIVHWNVSGRSYKTTWFWAFNHYPALVFERDLLIKGIERLVDERGWTRASNATIKRDVACFLRTYVSQPVSKQNGYEDSLESPLTELGLIRSVGSRRDGFRFVRGPTPSLGTGSFCYAVSDFWNDRFPNANTLSFESLAYEPGSPGRVFMLDENDLLDLLIELDSYTDGAYRWSETAGLKQLIRDRSVSGDETLKFLERGWSR
ncbi:MAG: DUF4007 family protein [Dehalococcoidia bacterium]|nr:DUF4007 family protein [Dehalococcoidia bacterium]